MSRASPFLRLTKCGVLGAMTKVNATRPAESTSDGEPVTIPRARQYNITSRINGRSYRLMISTPFGAEQDRAYPVLWLLDGNQYFGTATDALTRQSFLRNVAPAFVVGVGYPTDDPREVYERRTFDMTLSCDPSTALPTGGGDEFVRVIEEELKPFFFARYRGSREHQIIFGQSLGGIVALRFLFRHPTAFSTCIVSSPAISSNPGVLDDEVAFTNRVREGGLRLRILITSAGDEQYRGTDAILRARAEKARMIDNASELAKRLALLRADDVTVVRTIFEGELHNTVSQAVISRALRFALPLGGQEK